MDVIQGLPTTKGYAMGRAILKREELSDAGSATQCDPEQEAQRFFAAVEASKDQIRALAAKLAASEDMSGAEILESQLSFLNDPDIVEESARRIREDGIGAGKAVLAVTGDMAEEFGGFGDDYIRERAADIRDVGERVARNLSGAAQQDLSLLPPGTVLVAHDLKPSETALIDSSQIAAFVTETGGITCHTAIMARARGIVAVVGARGAAQQISDGDFVVVDGYEGRVLVNPDEEQIVCYREKIRILDEKRRQIRELCTRPVTDRTGKRIAVYANIGSAGEVETALQNGAEGIGLFRTELIYMGRDTLPDEEEQFRLYREVAERMDGRPVIIRTIDIGGDKDVPALNIPHEDNPFLGLRAIRLCLMREEQLFRTQLCAILRAAYYGNIRIMFPMISRTEEFDTAKQILEECADELAMRGSSFNGAVKVGMMIEVPSAALLAEEFAGRADFFSIGTNDLTQYTLAVDRMNRNVSALYDPLHPAVLRLIEMTAAAARNHGIPCGICGELAASPEATERLLNCGVDEFSMSAESIPEIKLAISGASVRNLGEEHGI